MCVLRVLDSAPDGLAGTVEHPDRYAAAAALEARELRLLAAAVGDHLPIELAMQVAELRARRAVLGA